MGTQDSKPPALIKVLRLIGGVDPRRGGPSVSAVNSAIACRRAGIDTTLACPLDPDEAPPPALDRLRGEGVAVETFPFFRIGGRFAVDWGVSAALWRWLRRHRGDFDILHCHSAWQMVTMAAWLGRGGAKTALSPHESLTDYDVGAASKRGMGPLKRALRPLLLTGFDSIVFSSPLEARDSVAAAIADRLNGISIYHPVFDDRMAAAAEPNRRAGGGLRLGYLGRLHVKKNVHLLIEALARGPAGATLLVAGDGAESDRLRALARTAGVADRVRFMGFVTEGRKPGFFRDIDALALVSDYECFGMAAAEAMVAGVPVILSEETGLTALARETGAGLIAARGADGIAAAIAALDADEDARFAMAERAAAAARAHLSFGAHGAALAACYAAMLDKATAR